MRPPIARGLLGVLSLIYIPLYLLVLFVAMVTSGDELVRQPGAWYAAVAPLAYVGMVSAYAFGIVTRRLSRPAIAAVHVAAAPALIFSFVGLGLLLPVFAVLWWYSTSREQVPATA